MNEVLLSRVRRVQRASLWAGLVVLALFGIGAVFNTRQFFISYLFAYLFWLGLSLGCLCVAMIHHLTGGRWGDVTRRFLEAGYLTLPLMAVLFVPMFLGAFIVGMNLIRSIQANQVCRDLDSMFIHGGDFSTYAMQQEAQRLRPRRFL